MLPADRIEKLGRSIIHHGPLNRRVYLMKLDRGDLPRIVPRLLNLANRHHYGKILAKVPERAAAVFRQQGFVCEARIPAFFDDGDDACFLAMFPDAARRTERHRREVERTRRRIAAVAPKAGSGRSRSGPAVRICRPEDVAAMRDLYRQVFESYPFPIYDRQYLAKTMGANVRYYAARDRHSRMVALAAGEMDLENRTVEMTDFAVLPPWRRRGISSHLLGCMEDDMRRRGMRIAFTIARSRSPGINIVFRRCGYRQGGLLINNTHIAGAIESMWVWHKRLTPVADSG